MGRERSLHDQQCNSLFVGKDLPQYLLLQKSDRKVFLSDYGSSYPRWDCTPEFAGSDFHVSTSNVSCLGFSPSTPCVNESEHFSTARQLINDLEADASSTESKIAERWHSNGLLSLFEADSCQYTYTPDEPRKSSDSSEASDTLVYWLVGGIVGWIFISSIVLFAVRRKRLQDGETTAFFTAFVIRGVRFSSPSPELMPPPPAPQPTVMHSNHPLNMGAAPVTFPAPQAASPHAPPPLPLTTYPAQGSPPPAYSAQIHAEPDPTFNPHYAPPDPPKQGFF